MSLLALWLRTSLRAQCTVQFKVRILYLSEIIPLIVAFYIGSEQEQLSMIGISGSENLARQTKEPAYFTADKAQSRIGSGVAASEPEVSTEKQPRLL